MTAHRFEGGCHCGNLSFVFEASAGLDVLGLRADQCSFCRAHNARTTSDPKGTIRIAARDGSKLSRYQFGLKTADFLVCSQCGVYIGAMMRDGEQQWMTVNVNAFKPPPPTDTPFVPVNFDLEDVPTRQSRRKARWTPVEEFRA
jgi:hypothetical protein